MHAYEVVAQVGLDGGKGRAMKQDATAPIDLDVIACGSNAFDLVNRDMMRDRTIANL